MNDVIYMHMKTTETIQFTILIVVHILPQSYLAMFAALAPLPLITTRAIRWTEGSKAMPQAIQHTTFILADKRQSGH